MIVVYSSVVTITDTDLKKLNNYPVIIVEDIVDTGETMKKVIEYIEGFKPSSVKVIPFL